MCRKRLSRQSAPYALDCFLIYERSFVRTDDNAATAVATTVADPKVFRSGREFAAWLGLVPRQNSTGGKTRLSGITKRGNRYLRRLLIHGASPNLLRWTATKADPWVIGLRRRRPPLVVAVALANKTARIAWAVMLREKEYQPRAMAA